MWKVCRFWRSPHDPVRHQSSNAVGALERQPRGNGTSMKITLLRDGPEKTFAVLLDQGDEPVSALLQFARDHKITAAHLTACGGFERVTLGYFEPSAKEHKRIAIHEQVELLSFMGDIARDDASVRPTMEIVESPWELRRRVREDVGAALLDLKRW